MHRLLRLLFFAAIVRPLVLVVLGLNIRHREYLPRHGPAIVVANHNSHLDTMVLMTLFPLRLLPHLRPAAAADYFLRSGPFAWFSREIIGIVPVDRTARERGLDPLTGCYAALERGDILVLFPEGTRGEPERLSTFKKGVSWLAERFPQVPVVPVFLHGLGKALPKGTALPVPFFCDVFVGEPITWNGGREPFMAALEQRMLGLSAEGQFKPWE
jgi:1-acyl-sn-glycerol-3-phosphate acyltransferase